MPTTASYEPWQMRTCRKKQEGSAQRGTAQHGIAQQLMGTWHTVAPRPAGVQKVAVQRAQRPRLLTTLPMPEHCWQGPAERNCKVL